MDSAATTVSEYLASLAPDRRAAIEAVRDVVNANLPAGYEEGIQYGMIGWYVPLARYPETYNGHPLAIASLGSQKNHMALYLPSVYADPVLATWFRNAFAAAGKKLDMGKSCVRFKSLDALPLAVIGETIAKVPVDMFLAGYEAAKGPPKPATPAIVAQEGPASTPTSQPARQPVSAKPASAKPASATPAAQVATRPAAHEAAKPRTAKTATPKPVAKPASSSRSGSVKPAKAAPKRKRG